MTEQKISGWWCCKGDYPNHEDGCINRDSVVDRESYETWKEIIHMNHDVPAMQWVDAELTRLREMEKRVEDEEELAKRLAHGERLVTDKDLTVEEYWNQSPRYLTDAYMGRAHAVQAYLKGGK